jgi:glycosyltransferase involved in cell wall biosynthesis
MSKIGVVVQRYGLEVNGGTEYHARVLAEKLSLNNHEVDIITTCALNYFDWKDEYLEGESRINSLKVIRFSCIPNNNKTYRRAKRPVFKDRKKHRFLKKINFFDFFDKRKILEPSQKECNNWIKAQGPYSKGLVKYLKENYNNYDCFIFFTYLYYPTMVGIQEVADKSILIPTAHDEPHFYTAPYKKLFSLPKFIMYNSLSEKKLVEKTYPNAITDCDITGIGIDKVEIGEIINIEEKYNLIKDRYFIYIGRVDKNKGCDELINYFTRYYKKNSQYKLVFVGQKFMEVPNLESIIFTGFVNDDIKNNLLKNCKALIIPSKFESLSLVTLEAMIESKLVIGSSECEVIKNHIETSTAGFCYKTYNEFETALDDVINMSNEKLKIRARKGSDYVTKNYSWKKIIEKFEKAIDFIKNDNV